MKIRELFKGDKKPRIGIYILLAAGIGLLLLGSLPEKNNNTEVPAEVTAAETDYVSELEEKLEQTLSSIEGAGRVSVTLVPRDKGSVDVGRDGSGETGKTVVLTGQGGSEPLIIAEVYPEIQGAVIVAQGAGDDRVRAILTEAASTALGIGAHRVKVYKGSATHFSE